MWDGYDECFIMAEGGDEVDMYKHTVYMLEV